jgi:hypothetical protein
MISAASFYRSSPTLSGQFPRTARKIARGSLPDGTKILLKDVEGGRTSRLASLPSLEVSTDTGIFSLEQSSDGKRLFKPLKFSDVYAFLCFSDERHVYELIPFDSPCHLYFDIEFLFSEHPEFCGDSLVHDLLARVDDKLMEVFGQTDYEIIDLTATTPKKFSRHLIIRSNEFCFRNNRNVGVFVKNEILLGDPLFSQIVDAGVYTKNRNFRCIWSTKRANGSNFPLVPTDNSNQTPKTSNFEYFLKTLITFVPANPHLIGYREPEILAAGFRPWIETETVDLSAPDLESFALSAFAPNGSIRTRRFAKEFNSLVLAVSGSRFCRRIGREHKSNGIYLVCRLGTGVVVQKCFDPDCKNWESEGVAIPERLLEVARRQCEGSVFVGLTSQRPKAVAPAFLDSDSDADFELD